MTIGHWLAVLPSSEGGLLTDAFLVCFLCAFDKKKLPIVRKKVALLTRPASIRATKRTPRFNAHTYNFEHSETSDEDNKMTDFYAGGGASKAPKTYAGAVRRHTSNSSKKTADDSYVAKVTCPVCHKGVPQDQDINAHVDLCLKN